MAWVPSLPTVLAALDAAWTAAAPNAAVIRGPQVGVGAQGVLTIGYQDENVPVVGEGTARREGFTTDVSREQYSVNCSAGVLNGAGDIEAATGAVCALWAAAGGALAADPRLGGACMSAQIGDWTLDLSQQPTGGAQALILFNVDVDAFTTT